MLVKYANFVKIQPIGPDKRVRPKASNLLVILIQPLSEEIHLAPLTHLAKQTILSKFSG